MKNNKIPIKDIIFIIWFIISFIVISLTINGKNLSLLTLLMGQLFLIIGIYIFDKTKNKLKFLPIFIGIILISIFVAVKIFKIDIFVAMFFFIPLFLFFIGLFIELAKKDWQKEIEENFIFATKKVVKNIEFKGGEWYCYFEYLCNNQLLKDKATFEFESDIPYKIGDEIDIFVDKRDYKNYIYLWEKENAYKKGAYIFMILGIITFIALLIAI